MKGTPSDATRGPGSGGRCDLKEHARRAVKIRCAGSGWQYAKDIKKKTKETEQKNQQWSERQTGVFSEAYCHGEWKAEIRCATIYRPKRSEIALCGWCVRLETRLRMELLKKSVASDKLPMTPQTGVDLDILKYAYSKANRRSGESFELPARRKGSQL